MSSVHHELRAGHYRIVVLDYAFRQYRIQVWTDQWHAKQPPNSECPDVLPIEF